MLSLLSNDVESYLSRFSSHKDSTLKAMERKAQRMNFPIIGPQVGKLLMLLVQLTGAKRIFEIGSGFGYSALWMTKALDPKGKITLTDLELKNIVQARKSFSKARQLKKARFLVGDAISLIRKESVQYDVIFLDADKRRYPYAFKAAWPKLRRGGLFITDNVLWSGRVARLSQDSDTKGIQRFNRLIHNNTMAVSTIIPLRDGLSVTYKK